MLKRIVPLFLVSLFCLNCQQNGDVSVSLNDDSSARQASNASALFSDSVGSFEVMVYYEIGAEPYVGTIAGTANNIWDLTKNGFVALFNNHVGRYIFVPNIIGQMIQIPDQKKTVWNAQDLNRIGNDYAVDLIHNGDARLTVIYLNGSYNGDSNTLGIHFRGTQYVFVFKDNVAAVGGSAKQQAYVEQAVVLHELGHASGLVNNGVPMTNGNHEDPAHPTHSSNPECVMNWNIENKSSVLGALANAISGDRMILFGADTLLDGRTFHP